MKAPENCEKPDDLACTGTDVCTTIPDMKTPGNQPETAQSESQKRKISQEEIDARLKVPFSERMHADLYIQGPASWHSVNGDGGRIVGEFGAACSGCQSLSRGGFGAVERNMEGGL